MPDPRHFVGLVPHYLPENKHNGGWYSVRPNDRAGQDHAWLAALGFYRGQGHRQRGRRPGCFERLQLRPFEAGLTCLSFQRLILGQGINILAYGDRFTEGETGIMAQLPQEVNRVRT